VIDHAHGAGLLDHVEPIAAAGRLGHVERILELTQLGQLDAAAAVADGWLLPLSGWRRRRRWGDALIPARAAACRKGKGRDQPGRGYLEPELP
jgi:hypothetical protein